MALITLPSGSNHGETVELVVPVYNEAAVLETSIRRLPDFLVASDLDGVHALRLNEKGRGCALRAAWSTSDADIVCYMDVDLSTDLRALLPLVAELVSGHSDVAIGTRLARGARIVRSRRREFISRAYNRLLHVVFRARFSDAQCGFKAIRAESCGGCCLRCATPVAKLDSILLAHSRPA